MTSHFSPPNPLLLGALCGLGSSLGYTAANACLRAVSHCDPIWVSCVKAVPTLLLVGPWLVVRYGQGLPVLPAYRVLLAIVLAGIFGQFVGNVAFQWSLGIVGLALEVPLSLGAMIVAGPILGRLVLGEGITTRGALSIGVLIAAVAVLSLGAPDSLAQVESAAAAGRWWLAAGVGAACLSGFAYAVLGVVIRRHVRGQAPLSTTLVAVALVGFVGLGATSLARIGPGEMLRTSSADLAMMLLAGVCNAGAFLALTKSLQLVPIVVVNACNATQSAMAFLAGAALFGESITLPMLAGLGLTVLGLALLRGPQRAPAPLALLAETPPAE